MSTFLELINEVLRRCGQETVSTLSNADSPAKQTVDFMNEIYFELLHSLPVHYLETKSSFNTVANTALYSISSDADVNYVLSDRVQNTNSQCYLTRVDASSLEANELSSNGLPSMFWIEGNQLRLHPIPNSSVSIEYYYLKRPTKLALDSDTTFLPSDWETTLIRGTQSLLEKFLGEPENSRISYAQYLDSWSLLKGKSRLKTLSAMKGFYRGPQS